MLETARYHRWPLERAVSRDRVGFIFLPLVSRKQRMLRCWRTPGISLQTFNSNITVLTDACKGITRGQDYLTPSILNYLLTNAAFFLVFLRLPRISGKVIHIGLLLLCALFFSSLVFMALRYTETLDLLSFHLTQSYFNVHFAVAPPI